MDRTFDLPAFPRRPASAVGVLGVGLVLAALLVLMLVGPFRTVPAGHVGVKDFFGLVSPQTLPPGIRLVIPFTRVAGERGIVVQQVLLRKIGLPPVVANAIQEKLRREQEAEQMKFVLQKEQQEAERKRIEAQGIADFQRIVAQGLNAQLLEWKGIEATEKLAGSSNAKVV